MDEQRTLELIAGAKSAVRSIACTKTRRPIQPGADALESESVVTCYQLADGRYRREDSTGTVIWDGRDMWVLRPDGRQAVKSPMPMPAPLSDVLSPSWLGTGEVVLVDGGETVVDGRPCRTVEAYGRSGHGEAAGSRGPQRYSMAVDAEYGVLLRLSDMSRGVRIDLSGIRVNDELAEALFQMVPLDGVEIIDPMKRIPGAGLSQLGRAAARQLFRRGPRG